MQFPRLSTKTKKALKMIAARWQVVLAFCFLFLLMLNFEAFRFMQVGYYLLRVARV